MSARESLLIDDIKVCECFLGQHARLKLSGRPEYLYINSSEYIS